MNVGILGGGQLGRMLALAGYPLGMRFRTFERDENAPAGILTPHFRHDYSDLNALETFADGLDVVTYEFENVPVAAARFLEKLVPVFPPPDALEAAQDRLVEKSFFQSLGIPTPACLPVGSQAELNAAVAQIGLPAILKTRRLGYDGKGQMRLSAPADVESAWNALGGQPLILEQCIAFERELSILAARGGNGEIAAYSLIENHHRDGILRLSLAPAPHLTEGLQAQAADYAKRVLDRLHYVGVIAIELFQSEGRLLANEMAPRVHNSGHWTIEGAETSQFENHLRAVTGLPLGSTANIGFSVMHNLIGEMPDIRAVLALHGAHLHLYDKAPRPGRKLGHITLRADDRKTLDTLHKATPNLLLTFQK